MLSRLLAIWQADPTFPSGGFAFSNGLEGVAARGELDIDHLGSLVRSSLRHRWATADRVALVRAWRLGDDLEAVFALDHDLDALTLAEPLRTGSRRNGAALVTSHDRLSLALAARLRSALRDGRTRGHLPVMQGALWRALGLDEAGCVAASGYGCVTGLVAAAVRLGRVGAVQAQGVVASCLPLLAELAARPVGAGDEMSTTTPFLDVAAARQSRAELRLFAN